MEEILHQLIGSLSHYLQGLYIPGGSGFLPSTVVVSQIWFIFNPNPWGVKMIQFGRLLILCHPRVASTTNGGDETWGALGPQNPHSPW